MLQSDGHHDETANAGANSSRSRRNLRRDCASGMAARAVCAAQYTSPGHTVRPRASGSAITADHRQSAAAGLSTTLVLRVAAPDFSTDAGNSALIVNNEVSATSCNAISACPAADEKQKTRSPIAS
jgi:hypothetical protein